MYDQVEPGDLGDVQAVQGPRSRALSHGAVRAARPSSARVDAEDPLLPRRALERVRPPSRRVYQ